MAEEIARGSCGAWRDVALALAWASGLCPGRMEV
jgi:hypothetical protein